MTIYECLGIENLLIDVTIPIETILENIKGYSFGDNADTFLQDVDDVVLKSSINRNEHYLQIIEIKLSSANHINEISFILQKAIKYRILFVFVYDERYLILHRNFNLTQSTENVYSQHINFCTDWIYGEYLCENIVCEYDATVIEQEYYNEYSVLDIVKVTDNDNGDFQFFKDIINNAQKLNACISQCYLMSARWLCDWYNSHYVKEHLTMKEILSNEYVKDSYSVLDEHVFIEKNAISNAITSILNWRFSPGMYHTGRHPFNFFNNIVDVASYEDEQEMKHLILSVDYIADENSEDYLTEDEKHELKKYVPISFNSVFGYCPTDYSTPQNTYIDEILRRHKLCAYHLIEDQALRYGTISRLRTNGYQFLEQFASMNSSNVSLLLPSMQIDLLLCMDKQGIRFKDCSYNDYSDIKSFISANFVCEDCGLPLDNFDTTSSKCYCLSCKERREHLSEAKYFVVEVDELNWSDDGLLTEATTTVSISGELESFSLDSLKIVESYIILENGKQYRSSSLNLIQDEDVTDYDKNESDTSYSVSWNSYDFEFSKENLKHIHFVFKDEYTDVYYLYVFRVDLYETIRLYDYISELDYAIEGAKQGIKMNALDSKRKKELQQYVKARQANESQCHSSSIEMNKSFEVFSEGTVHVVEEHRIEEEKRFQAEEMKKRFEEYSKDKERISKINEKKLEEERQKAEELRLEEKRRHEKALRLKEHKRQCILQIADILKQVYNIKFEEQEKLLNIQKLAYLLNEVYKKKSEEERKRAEQIRFIEERNNTIYESALKKYDSDNNAELESAIKQLEGIREWKDSLAQINKFKARIRYLAEERRKAEAFRIEQENKNQKYDQAVKMYASNNVSELNSAISILEGLAGWKDSSLQISRLKNKVSLVLKEEEEKRKAEYRSKKLCQHCGGMFKGLFIKVCKNCGIKKDY